MIYINFLPIEGDIKENVEFTRNQEFPGNLSLMMDSDIGGGMIDSDISKRMTNSEIDRRMI